MRPRDILLAIVALSAVACSAQPVATEVAGSAAAATAAPLPNTSGTELAIKGQYRGRAKTVTWRWDEPEGRYISTVTPKDQAAGM